MTGRAHKITSEIFQVGGSGLTAPEDAAIYLIRFGDQAALVDAGCGYETERLEENIRSAGTVPGNLRYLLLTHCHFDHTGGAMALRESLKLPVIAHELDAPYLEQGDPQVTAASWYGAAPSPCPVDRKLRNAEETISLGDGEITAIHVPGHSPGSVVYVTRSDDRTVLFGQDVHGPLHPTLLSNEADYRRSLQRLLAIEADILCEGHFGILDGKKSVAKFIRSYLRA
ncbi:MAG: MBL fold metallo-hydrolase [Alphaproteobacteria bacterium]